MKEIIYTINSPRIEDMVQSIDSCLKQENKAGVLYYVNYIKNYVEFMEG